MGVVVDTCIWIDVERGRLSPADVQTYTGENPVFISPVTLAELTFGVEMSRSVDVRQKRAAALQRLRKKPVLLINENTGVLFGQLSAELKRQGRGADFRIQDLWIAAQAIQNNFALLTYNKKDFMDIPGLQLIVPGQSL